MIINARASEGWGPSGEGTSKMPSLEPIDHVAPGSESLLLVMLLFPAVETIAFEAREAVSGWTRS